MKKQSGFTLIELMIAMAIVAILATAGISAYTGYVKKGRDTARAEIAQNLNTAVMSYAASNGGNPPASKTAFDDFLASTSEVFGGGSSGGGNLALADPVGGKNVCLDAQDGATQPCSFDYTAYEDGTYAISYGVEHDSSRERNFYKTTKSIPASNAYPNSNPTPADFAAQPTKAKYGVYVGSARYIGQTATQSNGTTNDDGIDETYWPGGAVLIPVFRSIRVDNPVGVTRIVSGGTCTQGDLCEGALLCISGVCRTSNVTSGGLCDVSEQCTSSLSCLSGVCRITDIANGIACDVSEQCTGTFCVNGFCSDGSIGSPCNDVSQCSPEAYLPDSTWRNLSCSLGVCSCGSPCIISVDP